MTHILDLSTPTTRAKRSARLRVPFMTLLVGGMAALAVALGALNNVLEDWVVAKSDFGQMSEVEFVSGQILAD